MRDSNESLESNPASEKLTSSNDENQPSLLDLVPNYEKSWIHVPHLFKLNLAVLVIILSSTTSGYDASMLNGLQAVPKWSRDMGSPQGAVLGAMSNGELYNLYIN